MSRVMRHPRKRPGAWSIARAWVGTLHRDTRGAISILVLLTIWCLVALLGMVWNTAEEARRRAQVQTAADAAAHAAGTWMARMGNTITAQNMVICQDASAESIWGALTPTAEAIDSRLSAEVVRAMQMKQQHALPDLANRLAAQLEQIGSDYELTSAAITGLQDGTGANYANATEAWNYNIQYRQARSAMDWVYNTYVNGHPASQPPGAPARPGPPGPNGMGLTQVVENWKLQADQNTILDYIINYINSMERQYWITYVNRTSAMAGEPISERMAVHELEVYENELAMLQAFSDSVEEQRAQLAEQYGVDITLATLKNGTSSVESVYSGTAAVVAPYMPAGNVPPWLPQADLIRVNFPVETQQAGLLPEVTIDPISPHTNENRIWHPPLTAYVPLATRIKYQALRESYQVSADFPEGWGHIWAMPLERYFQERVSADLRDINNNNMQPLDDARSITLARAIREMLGIGQQNATIADLPGQIPDDQPHPPVPGTPAATQPAAPVYDNIWVLPRITAPANASADFRTRVELYNTYGAKYTADVRQARALLENYVQFFQTFIRPFAQDAWQTNVHASARAVIEVIGQKRQFMVPTTYRLRPIPDWAREGMYQSVVSNVESQVMSIAMMPVMDAIIGDLSRDDSGKFGVGVLDRVTRSLVLTGNYSAEAAGIADQIVRPKAHQIALDIAAEWLNRPWPYEITPPDQPVPPFRGVLPEERMVEYTVLGAARETDATAPRLLLPSIFGTDSTKIVAYGQGEMFNWQEFNPLYGAQRYDQVTRTPELVYRFQRNNFTNFVGAPRGWRVASRGGWDWRGRLSRADALYDALQNNPDLAQYLQDAGISNPSGPSLDALNLH